MFAAGLALAASASWGIGDFLAGTRSRLMSPLAVLALSQPVGLVLLAIAVAARGTGPPDVGVAWACLGGVFGTVGLASFYRGMATGAISIVAPIAGAAAVIPVVYGLATGDDTTGLQEAGFAVAIVGVVLTSLDRRPGGRWAAGAGFAAIATLSFGIYFILMHEASTGDFLWAAFLFRVTSTALVWLAVLALRPTLTWSREQLPALGLIGVLDAGGNTLYAAAAERAAVSVTSVLASLYPVVTVLLARRRLHERIERGQEAGVALTLAGIVLVSTG